MMHSDTIAAISTPLGAAGMGVIRLSGPQALSILTQIFLPWKPQRPHAFSTDIKSQCGFASHRVYYGHIKEKKSGKLVDEALVFYMKQPNSFTREDIVEIQSHGGIVNMERVLTAVLDCGARLAEPGEFTKRAFLNGRIDLTQAESIIELINAPCETAAEIASVQMTGSLSKIIGEIASILTSLRSQCEADIEFGEAEDIKTNSTVSFIRQTLIEDLLPRIQHLIQHHKDMAIYRTGMTLTIIGSPNVGKSSLMNMLVDNEVSIVSEFPGTTRDVLKAYLSVRGIPIVACDTAGIHDSIDPVEKIGISKAWESIYKSDIVLLVLDAEAGIRSFEFDFLQTHEKNNVIVVINKIDLCDEKRIRSIESQIRSDVPLVETVAISGKGLEDLKNVIARQVTTTISPSFRESTGIPNIRQKKILEAIEIKIKACIETCIASFSLDMISDMIGDVLKQIDDISGRSDKKNLYEEIFSQFCIGK